MIRGASDPSFFIKRYYLQERMGERLRKGEIFPSYDSLLSRMADNADKLDNIPIRAENESYKANVERPLLENLDENWENIMKMAFMEGGTANGNERRPLPMSEFNYP